MNLLNSKLDILCLLAVITLSLFFTACKDDNPTPQTTKPAEVGATTPTPAKETEVLILKSFTGDVFDQIIENATQNQMKDFRNNYLTFRFLEEVGKLDDALIGFNGYFQFNLDHLIEDEKIALDKILLVHETREACPYSRICLSFPTKTCHKSGIPYPCNWKLKCDIDGFRCW